ncbi:MAG: 1-aminocyclopropane-1-carboxylate deaminase/D-cysteine desulfhydrase, partial [Maribacter sp.]
MQSVNQPVRLPLLTQKQVTLVLKREDLLHPFISGNKYRKLKYNLLEAQRQGHETLLTFGGAFSNHILATAFAASERGLKSIGVIRGDELEHTWQDNPTLAKAHTYGMVFKFVSREIYRAKAEVSFLTLLQKQFGRFYV